MVITKKKEIHQSIEHRELEMEVRGVPVPQGSMRAFVVGGKARLTHNKGRELNDWRSTVQFTAQRHVEREDWDMTKGDWIELGVHFRIPRPASVSARKRPRPNVSPDIDKLLRAVLDSLTGVVYLDDSQVVSVHVSKEYANEAQFIGAVIRVDRYRIASS